jgi:hypothetical protein
MASVGPPPQDADDLAQVLERLVGVLADHLGGAGDLLGGGVGAELERAGVDAQQRQAVAEDVVHLPGDLVAGALLGLLGPQLGLGLGPVGPVAQGQHQLAPAQSQPGAAHRPGGHVGGEQPARRWRGRLQPPADHQQREAHRGQEQQRVHDPVARAAPDPRAASVAVAVAEAFIFGAYRPRGPGSPCRPRTIPKSRRPLLPSVAAHRLAGRR